MSADRLKLTAREIGDFLECEIALSSEEADLEPVGAELHVWFRITPCSGEAVVTGRVRAEIPAECAVCLAPLEMKVEEEFSAVYPLSPDVEIDLLPDVRDAFMAGVPIRLKCSPECKGLCAKCGKNLNQGPCSCSPSETSHLLKIALDEALEEKGSS